MKMRYKIVNSAAEDIITNYSIDNMTWLDKNIYKNIVIKVIYEGKF